MDSDALVDTLWNHALRALATDTRQRFDNVQAERGGRPLAILSNGASDYFSWLNGTLYEYFPSGASNPDIGNLYGYNWNQEMLALPSGYLVAPFRSTPYRGSVLNADWSGTLEQPDRSAQFERHKRFVPVTLDGERKRAATQATSDAAQTPVVERQRPSPSVVTPAAAEKKEPQRPEGIPPAVQDESVKLDASFFEQDEYAAPAKPSVKAAAVPKEIEKARRFARLVVSDIALYNQETVTEGRAKGTFYELLKEDIAEGRALYDKRVPEAIRATDDYYQEAFDNFIAAKKKQR